ncbi:Uncharacterized protein Adt_11117 [Abeliophyllum distichum]|uniref:Ubiquitin-like protease family profile domain-containing protein n=1 Tax=Abeliophyllum distichum TaxID=126358 RepID=A0ABD1ULX7_9LAMI
MGFAFKSLMEVAQMLKDSVPKYFTCQDYLFDYIHGKLQLLGQPWEGCTHLYILVLANAHWFVADVNFFERTVYVYNPDKSSLKQGQIEKCLESMCYFIHVLAKSVNIVVWDTLRVQRIDDTVKQKISVRPLPPLATLYTLKAGAPLLMRLKTHVFSEMIFFANGNRAHSPAN